MTCACQQAAGRVAHDLQPADQSCPALLYLPQVQRHKRVAMAVLLPLLLVLPLAIEEGQEATSTINPEAHARTPATSIPRGAPGEAALAAAQQGHAAARTAEMQA
jgi:hypothetical protein